MPMNPIGPVKQTDKEERIEIKKKDSSFNFEVLTPMLSAFISPNDKEVYFHEFLRRSGNTMIKATNKIKTF